MKQCAQIMISILLIILVASPMSLTSHLRPEAD